MATWTLKTQHKKSAVEKQYWRKDSEVIICQSGTPCGSLTSMTTGDVNGIIEPQKPILPSGFCITLIDII
jgi:hypothetical protein